MARFRADRESSDYENILKNCKFEEEVDISRPSPSSTWPTLDEIESRESFQLSIHDRALLSSFGDLRSRAFTTTTFFFFSLSVPFNVLAQKYLLIFSLTR